MPSKKRARYTLRYRVTAPSPADGLRAWWRDHHSQEEVALVWGTSYDDAWYTLLLLHDDWQRHPPQLERKSAARRRR
jgi:hypothetical protein